MRLTLAILVVVVGLTMAARIDTNKQSEKDEMRRATVEKQKEFERRAIEALAKELAKDEARRELTKDDEKDERRDLKDDKESEKDEKRRRELSKKEKKDEERREIEKEAEKERRDIGSGGEFRWETIPIAENASQCIYSPETRSMSCRGMSGLVECPASMDLPKDVKVEVFGMRRHPVKSMVAKIDERVFELYPRKLDNSTYLNYTVLVEGKPVELYLYYADSTSETMSGVRVSDKKCFVRLVNVVLSQATTEHEVKVEGTELKVDLFGEVLNAEKPNNKRWLGFGWPWLWGMGMWGWGLGWGLPFWG